MYVKNRYKHKYVKDIWRYLVSGRYEIIYATKKSNAYNFKDKKEALKYLSKVDGYFYDDFEYLEN